LEERLRRIVQRLLPVSIRRKIVRYTRWPPVGWVRFGSLRRLRPISSTWGSERGQPIDRYYIERFLATHRSDIRGHVLEVGTNKYTRQFGEDKVIRGDVLHVSEDRPEVTLIADLTHADHIPALTFDCVILTQTLQVIFDLSAALATVHRILKPGGVVLATVPGISKISRYDMERWGHYWSFTTHSCRRLFEAFFPAANVAVGAHGNVLVAISFLHGLANEELHPKELGYVDPDYQLLITARAVKPKDGT
jgi:SAM-dependent methyltransferase